MKAGVNTYGYVGATPLTEIDPSGEVTVPPLGYAFGVLGAAYGVYSLGMLGIDFVGDSVEAYMCYRDHKLAQNLLNTAIKVCASDPKSPACNSLGFYQSQLYRTAGALTKAGGHLSSDDMRRKSRRE